MAVQDTTRMRWIGGVAQLGRIGLATIQPLGQAHGQFQRVFAQVRAHQRDFRPRYQRANAGCR